jgi:magnesium chelatase subunit I
VLGEARKVQGLMEMARRAGIPADAPAPLVAAAIDFVLEGLYAQKKISRSDGRGFHGTEPARRPAAPERRTPVLTPDDDDEPGNEGGGRKKKRYYN